MENFKNESGIIVSLELPLIEAEPAAIFALFEQAEFLLNKVKTSENPESFSSKLLLATAHGMFESASLELIRRN
jgi:hypothetical protein